MQISIKRFSIATFILISSYLLGCGRSEKGGSQAAPTTIAGKYEYNDPHCSTGSQSYSSLEEFCAKIVDEPLNNGCARERRQLEFERRCPQKSASNFEAPKESKCFKPARLVNLGQEVEWRSMVDGSPGFYRLTSVQIMSQLKSGQTHASYEYMALVDKAQGSDKASGALTCKDSMNFSYELITESFSIPLSIRRENGLLEGSMKNQLMLHSNGPIIQDDARTFLDESFPYDSLEIFKSELMNSNRDFQVRKISPTKFNILIFSKTSDLEDSSQTIFVASYSLQNTPTAGLAVNTQAFEQVVKICLEHDMESSKIRCFEKFKTSTPPLEVIPICASQDSIYQKESCLEKLRGKSFAKGVTDICDEQESSYSKISCLIKLADFNFPEATVSACERLSSPPEKVRCLIRLK